MRHRLVWEHEARIGEAMRKLREDAGLTTRQFAERLGCAHSRVVKVEQGQQRIALDEFIVWSERIGVDAADLLRSILHEEAWLGN